MLARDLLPGDHLVRGLHSWEVTKVGEPEARKVGGPIVFVACTDHEGTLREFTLPDDLPVVAYRDADGGGVAEVAGG